MVIDFATFHPSAVPNTDLYYTSTFLAICYTRTSHLPIILVYFNSSLYNIAMPGLNPNATQPKARQATNNGIPSTFFPCRDVASCSVF